MFDKGQRQSSTLSCDSSYSFKDILKSQKMMYMLKGNIFKNELWIS